jgi:hypothetical protein
MGNPFSHFGVTDQEYSEYGDEFLRLTAKLAGGLAYQETQKLANDVVTNLRRVEKRNTVAHMKQRLEAEFGGANFHKMNTDPGFNNWLDTSGQRAVLDKAFNSGDIDTCVEVYRKYAHVPEHQRPDAQRESSREAMRIAADRDYGRSGGNRGQGKVWTRSEITRFYKDVGLGRIKEAEKDRIEADIIRATSEGRVRG